MANDVPSPSVNALSACVRIVTDAAVYRIKKREAANLLTSMTLALALGLGVADLGVRFAFGALLNLWVYLVNDLIDVDIDLRAPGRDQSRVGFLAAHLREGWSVIAILSAILLAMGAAHSTGLLVSAISTALIIVAYTRYLKRRPIADLLAMAGWGVSMALVGFPIESPVGWRFAGLLAILCAITEAVQVIRDVRSDGLAGVRTTAVVLGTRPTVWIVRALVVATSAYVSAWLSRWVGPAFLLGLLVPIEAERATRSWDGLRIVFGLGWLSVLVSYAFLGRLDGWMP